MHKDTIMRTCAECSGENTPTVVHKLQVIEQWWYMGQIHVNFTDDLMSYYKCRDSWMWASAVTRSKLSHSFTTCLMHDSRPEQGKTEVGADTAQCGWIALSSLLQLERSQFLVERGCEVPHSAEAEKARGVNEPYSTSMMRCSYFRFLAFSSHLKHDSRDDRL